jgi:hypothetical protein
MVGFNDVASEKGSSLLKPGCPVPVTLNKLEITEGGDLDITFVGSNEENKGSFKPRFWLNNQDVSNAKYNETKATRAMAQLKQILEAFIKPEEIADMKANNHAELFGLVAAKLSTCIGGDANMKIVYKSGSDSLCELPFFGEFISTDLKPRSISISDKKNKEGVPYDRVRPMAEYGIAPTGGAPWKADDNFGEEEIPTFGS